MEFKEKILSILIFTFCLLLGIQQTSYGKEKIIQNNPISGKNLITVLIPPTGEKAYGIAGEAFADLWERVTGQRPAVILMESGNIELPEGDVVVIGSDAVNPIVHNLIRSGTLEGLDIVYGGDNYRMLSIGIDGRNCLILAGGSGRSTIYAVYDFFRKQAGVEYFWDGDVIPHSDQIKLTGIDVDEQPRFEYRGLRYFAHRGLHRFQAEHWDLEDWKVEIDWLMKKRFNMFMLRTGIDDLFQRAFPNDVSYPPVDAQDPDAQQRSFNDRTSFWQLKYRGELRKQVLQYARDRGLLHPEDVGTITHWYSHTPSSFYRSNPDFPVIKDQKSGYSLPTHAIWDIESQRSWDTYWKLTETHIHEFGGGTPRLFHTIGMAERTFGATYRENLQSKLYVYRKTQQKLREHYPDVPLLIASWDFSDERWKDNDVQNLLKEFDPNRTIIFDYTSDNISTTPYRDWGLFNKFPWIFGIIHSFANNSDIHGNYKNIIAPRLQEASADSKCIGLVTWSEISHSDTYLLEYVADNSWQPKRLEVEKATERYCDSRYPTEIAKTMKPLWSSFLTLSQSHNWGRTLGTVREPQFRILTSRELINLTPDHINELKAELQRLQSGLKRSTEVLRELAGMADKYFENPFWQRDAIDMARTISSSALLASMDYGAILMDAWRHKKSSPSEIKQFARLSQDLLASMSDILSLSDDFSMYASLNKLSNAKELGGVDPLINPHSEQTLKANAENGYCRSHHYELVEYVYRSELNAYWNWVLKRIKSGDRSEWNRPPEFREQEKIIADRFYDTPLSEMAPTVSRNSKNMSKILIRTEQMVNKLLHELDINSQR
jgi:alpha-N-acetylglucosaminidase (NAGLU)-like protein